jgi:hypothetical protein
MKSDALQPRPGIYPVLVTLSTQASRYLKAWSQTTICSLPHPWAESYPLGSGSVKLEGETDCSVRFQAMGATLNQVPALLDWVA